jgi:hypothetical protein
LAEGILKAEFGFVKGEVEASTYLCGALDVLCVRGNEAGLVLVWCRHFGVGSYVVEEVYVQGTLRLQVFRLL